MANKLLNSENHLFQLARQRRLRWPERLQWLYPIAVLFYAVLGPLVGQIIVFVPVVIGLIILNLPLEILSNPDSTSFGSSVILVLAFVPIFVLVWLWLKIFERRPLWTIGLENYEGLRRYFRGLAVGLIMFSAAVAIMALLGYTSIESATAEPQFGVLALGLLTVFVGWMIQGAAEETLTRGFLLPILGVQWGPAAGIVVSSLLFAVLHLLNPSISVVAMLNLFLFGVFAALYALSEGDLWGVFAIHAVWNFVQGNLFGFEVSGQLFGATTLLDFTETGPDLLTGGPFGPEGGLIVTGVLLAGCLWVWYRSSQL